MYKNKNFFIILFLLICFDIFLFTQNVSAASCSGACVPSGDCPNGSTQQGTCDSGAKCCVVPNNSSGGFNYQLLEKIPGKEGVGGNDLSQYITAIYDTALVIVVLSAVLMASIGGFMYLTSAGNTAAMGTAKGVIFDAVIGLVIALAAWLLLNVINPDLVNVKIKSLSVITEVPIPEIPKEGQSSHDEAVTALKAAGIEVTSTGNCSDPNNKTCTSLQGIPKSTIDNLIKLKNEAKCDNFTVTGGTETGHLSHGAGKPVIDISENFCIKNFLRDGIANKTIKSTNNIIQICATQRSQDAAFKCSTIEAKPHFHLVFSA